MLILIFLLFSFYNISYLSQGLVELSKQNDKQLR